MPLPTHQPRKHLHKRSVVYDGYLRDDGLWDIEARVTDVRTYDTSTGDGLAIPAGDAVHDMYIRTTLDDTLTIREISAEMASRPFGECMAAEDPMQKMIGVRMGPGWRQAIEKALGGIQGCTHLRELLFNMATAAYQTIPVYQFQNNRNSEWSRDANPANAKPPFHLGKCMSWDFNGSVVKRIYPAFAGWQPLQRAPAGEAPLPVATIPASPPKP